MASISGQPIPFHVPTEVVTTTPFTVGSELGVVYNQVVGAAVYTLPLISTLTLGSSLKVVNQSAAGSVTLTAATGNTIQSAATLVLRAGAQVVLSPQPAGTDWSSSGIVTTGGAVVSGPAAVVTQLTSNTTAVTANGNAGKITMFGALTTAASTLSASFTVNNNLCVAGSAVVANVTAYTGTDVTNGMPQAVVRAIGAGSFTVAVYNTHPANALSGVVTISFALV